MSKITIFIIALLILGGGYFWFKAPAVTAPIVDENEPTVALSHCGLTVHTPLSNAVIGAPISITTTVDNTNMQTLGCNWVTFEAQAAVIELKNSNGVVLGQSLLTTTDDWMQSGPVTYTSTLTPTTAPTSGDALTLVFTEENPSGEGVPDTLIVPVVAQ